MSVFRKREILDWDGNPEYIGIAKEEDRVREKDINSDTPFDELVNSGEVDLLNFCERYSGAMYEAIGSTSMPDRDRESNFRI